MELVKPTEAELHLVRAIKRASWASDELHYVALIREHMAAEVARETVELRKDSERLSWLQDHADEMEIRFFTSDALHYYAQEFMNGKHTILRWCIDQAMKATAHKSSPPPPAS